MPWVMVR